MGLIGDIANGLGFQNFDNGSLDCDSLVELWVKRFKQIPESQQVCYYENSNLIDCVEGNGHQINYDGTEQGGQCSSQLYNIQATYHIRRLSDNVAVSSYENRTIAVNIYGQLNSELKDIETNGQHGGQEVEFFSNHPNYDNSFNESGQSNFITQFGCGSIFYLDVRSIKYIRTDGTSIEDDENQCGNNRISTITIYNNSDVVLEYSSNETLTASNEEILRKCTIKDQPWQIQSSWNQEAGQKLYVIKAFDCLQFILKGSVLASRVANLCKGEDCNFPLFKLVTRTNPTGNCTPEKQTNCPEGTEWNETLQKCLPIECSFPLVWNSKTKRCEPPKCPEGTAEQYECDGYLCCYDECGNLIKSMRIR